MRTNQSHRIAKNLLFASVLLLLFLPVIQQQTNLIKLKPLDGSFERVEKPLFSATHWLGGTYQTKQQTYLNENVGLRSFFVRLHNQLRYSLYQQTNAKGVVIGKEAYLYEKNYIHAYLGRDFIGKNKIKEKIEKLARLSDTLKSKGIELIVLLAPGKASFYPEFIPDRFDPKHRTTTNYEVYQKAISEKGIHLLDFHHWFRSMKNAALYPLYPKTGIHWSKYGELLAADSIIHYINSIQSEKQIPELLIGDVETSVNMRETDDDVEKGMNLLVDVEDLPMGYPDFQVQEEHSLNKATVLTVGDSYYWNMFNWGLSRQVFNQGQFWYYNKLIYPDSYTKPTRVEDLDLIKEVEKNDVIILLSTDANLPDFAFGFIDQLYDAYFNSGRLFNALKADKEKRIQYFIHAIETTPTWLESAKNRALEKNMPLEEVIRKNAEYMLWAEENEE